MTRRKNSTPADVSAPLPAPEGLIDRAPEKSSTSEVGSVTITLSFDEYVSMKSINPGLIASFRAESRIGGDFALLPKTEADWDRAFAEQSQRIY